MTPEQQEALAELRQKSLSLIQYETARRWAYRAWAARQLGFALDAVEYEHEAIEHAALCGAAGALALVRRIIEG